MTGDHQTPDPRAGADDVWLETLLRDDASTSGYVVDAGFTQSVMNGLPMPARRSALRWIVPAMAVAGCVLGLGWLSGGEELTLSLAGLLQVRSLSWQSLLVAVLPLGVLYWLALGAAWQQR